MTLALHDYQRAAVEHLHAQPHAGLFLVPGLGKTAITLSSLTPERLPALVCAPKRVCAMVWPTEARKWRPDLTVSLAAGTPRQRAAALQAGADVTVISRDNLADAIGGPWKTLVLDELSGFKAKTTNRWKAARKIAARAEYRVGLTGTPGGLLDLWAQVALLDGGTRLGSTLGGYRSRYFTPGRIIAGGVVTDWLPREGAHERVYASIADIVMAMPAIEGMVPPATYSTTQVELPAPVRAVYSDLVRDLVAYAEMLGEEALTVANLAVLSNKLSQLAAGFAYLEDGSTSLLHTEKVDALREITDDVDTPVLVFYRYKAERDAFLAAIPGARGIDEPGVLDAWDRGEVHVMLAHPQSAGHGLNLQTGGARTMVWSSLPWSLELYEQGIGRLVRQGQEHSVVIHTLEAVNTVDRLVADRLAGKEFTQAQMLAALQR